MRESAVRSAVLRVLRDAGAVVWAQTGAVNSAGRPDLAICYRGRFVAVELKSPRGRTHPRQLVHLEEVVKAGGFAAIVRSADDMREVLRQVDAAAAGVYFPPATLKTEVPSGDSL
jgi:hypothetical protein